MKETSQFVARYVLNHCNVKYGGNGVRFKADRNVSILYSVQTGIGPHPTFYPKGIGGLYSRSKGARA
jgi:hypothetical protein